MGELKVLASGDSHQKQAQARGKLFENLMAEVLRNKGYKVDFPPNTRYTGMEIDIEGIQEIIGIPIYVECKYYYDKEIECPDLMKFYGKYMIKWFEDPRCQGIFIALPGINIEAKTAYNEKIRSNSKTSFALYEKEDVLEVIFNSRLAVRPEVIAERIPRDQATPGDWTLLYTNRVSFGHNLSFRGKQE